LSGERALAFDGEEATSVLVWFEDNREGRAALLHAYEIADAEGADLTVLTVATQERSPDAGSACRARALESRDERSRKRNSQWHDACSTVPARSHMRRR